MTSLALFPDDPQTGLSEASPAYAPVADPLRVRAERDGLTSLTEAEVLTLMLVRTERRGAATYAEALLRRFGDLQHVLGAPRADLATLLAPDSVLELKLQHDLARRLLLYPMARRSVISSWTSLLSYLRVVCAAAPRELFRVLFLDKKNQLLADEVMGEGTVDHAPVYPREVVRRALELHASAIILCHQHPSGDPTPSQADVEMTRRIVEAARGLSITV
ncbi:MAG TPA: DNA repair protein RadC, partial [Phenylobacterium sp.]